MIEKLTNKLMRTWTPRISGRQFYVLKDTAFEQLRVDFEDIVRNHLPVTTYDVKIQPHVKARFNFGSAHWFPIMPGQNGELGIYGVMEEIFPSKGSLHTDAGGIHEPVLEYVAEITDAGGIHEPVLEYVAEITDWDKCEPKIVPNTNVVAAKIQPQPANIRISSRVRRAASKPGIEELEDLYSSIRTAYSQIVEDTNQSLEQRSAVLTKSFLGKTFYL